MTEKFILVSLDEEKSKKLAEVISNKTSRRILEYLSDKEGTSSDVSKELGIALSTVEYNLKNMVNAELVGVEEFRWSPKGRQQDIYKVKRKYIVIAPENNSELRETLKRVLPIGLFGAVISGILEFIGKSRTISIPSVKETITRTVTQKAAIADKVLDKGTETIASSSIMKETATKGVDFVEPVVNVTSKVSESFRDVVIPDPHYGVWFLLGLVLALGLYVLFSLNKK